MKDYLVNGRSRLCILIFPTFIQVFYMVEDMGQSIQEWTKQNLWKTAFKKIEEIWSA